MQTHHVRIAVLQGAAQCCHQKLSSWAPTQIGHPQSSAVKPASRARRHENKCMPVKGRVCAATVIHPAAPPEANAECKISCTPARPVMLLRLTRAERAGACAGAREAHSSQEAMHIRWHSAPSNAVCEMRDISSQAVQNQAPRASQDVPQCAARQCRRAYTHRTAHLQ